MATPALYTTYQLLDVLKVMKLPNPFWLKFFPNVINFTTDKIAFDKVSADYRRLAPFVSPNIQGRVMTSEGYSTNEFKPAYVKPKHIIDVDAVLVRRAGEAIGSGSLSPMQRRDAVIADLLDRHSQMHLMTWEWMAAKAIIDGKVTITGENYPTVTVDFGRDATLTSTLLTTAAWDQTATANPLKNISDMRNKVRNLTGAVVRDVVFGLDAWSWFSGRDDVKALMNTQQRGSETNVSLVVDGFEDSFEFVGEVKGNNGAGLIRCWLYSGKFKDANDTLQDIMEPGAVVGVAPSVEGVRCFGAIKDKGASYQALSMFPKMWEEEDPSVEYLMTQGAPLMVPKQPNATFKILATTAGAKP